MTVEERRALARTESAEADVRIAARRERVARDATPDSRAKLSEIRRAPSRCIFCAATTCVDDAPDPEVTWLLPIS
jgi:hypothetical protein